MKKVKLSKVIDALEMIDQENNAYLNKKTYEIVILNDEDFKLAEGKAVYDAPSWQLKSIELASDVMYSDTYISLPTKYNIHDYKIMEKFCFSLSDELSDICLYEIKRRKAFANFKNFTHKYDLTNRFYDFKKERYKDIAINWLEYNNLKYEWFKGDTAMLNKEELKHVNSLDKEWFYEQYLNIDIIHKDYDRITKRQMLEAIYNEISDS